MELRRVDPRCLKKNPGNPRKIQPGEMSDAALAASIGAIGILQPPVVSEKNGELTIAYGARRVRIAIAIGLPEIDVLVKDPDDHDHMRSVSENVVRAPMATVDLWRAIESLASENWTEEAIASALAVSLRQIRKLRLLATRPPRHSRPDRRGRHAERTRSAHHRLGVARGSGRGVEEAEAQEERGRPLVADQPGVAEDALLRQGRQIRRGRARGLRHRLAGRPFRRGRRGQSFHHRRRGLRRRPARMGRREHAEERRLDRNRPVRPRETAAEGESHLGEAEEGRPDRLCDRSARRQDPRSGVPHLRARRDEGQGSFDRRKRRRADAEEDAARDHPKGD